MDRTSEVIDRAKMLTNLVAKHPDGLQKRKIRQMLDLTSAEYYRALVCGIALGWLRIVGDGRGARVVAL